VDAALGVADGAEDPLCSPYTIAVAHRFFSAVLPVMPCNLPQTSSFQRDFEAAEAKKVAPRSGSGKGDRPHADGRAGSDDDSKFFTHAPASVPGIRTRALLSAHFLCVRGRGLVLCV
jgi:hypothetical protein